MSDRRSSQVEFSQSSYLKKLKRRKKSKEKTFLCLSRYKLNFFLRGSWTDEKVESGVRTLPLLSLTKGGLLRREREKRELCHSPMTQKNS